MRINSLILLTALSACGGSTPPGPNLEIENLPATVILKLGEERTVHGAIVQFAEVRNDSRCPQDVQCVSSGNAEVGFTVGPSVGDGPSYSVVLNTSIEPRAGSALGLTLTLLKLIPEPVSSTPTRDYRAEIRITAAP